ncbi:MAG: hypothetical protein RJQ09_00470 [Cyclobacteriaceae bacterium]
MRFIIAALLTIVCLSCADKSSQDFKVPDLKGLKPLEIKSRMGEPDTSYNRNIIGKQLFVMRYFDLRDAEFRFERNTNILGEILINKPFDLKFEPAVISNYGLSALEPSDADTASHFRWKNIDGLKNVNVYKVGMERPEGVETYFKIYFDLK